MIEHRGSVRVDLLGGTIDLPPIPMIIPNVVTLNVATGLQAVAKISPSPKSEICFESLDYKKTVSFPIELFSTWDRADNPFGELQFVALITSLFYESIKNSLNKDGHRGLHISLQSGSPAGAGLGGSSAMGITLFSALAKFFNLKFGKKEIYSQVTALEAKILNKGPAGYQDYFPALYGGILALKTIPGTIEVEQLYSQDLRQYLENSATLIFSGETRLSGINNWEVYKKFFDGDPETRKGLGMIAELSKNAYDAIKNKKFEKLSSLIIEEGKVRKGLFPNILSPSMKEFEIALHKLGPSLGLKVCGAGGGGCFLAIHSPENKQSVLKLVKEYSMQELPFKILPPCEELSGDM